MHGVESRLAGSKKWRRMMHGAAIPSYRPELAHDFSAFAKNSFKPEISALISLSMVSITS